MRQVKRSRTMRWGRNPMEKIFDVFLLFTHGICQIYDHGQTCDFGWLKRKTHDAEPAFCPTCGETQVAEGDQQQE